MLHYDRHRGQHHVLYEDGEDEALRLGGEAVRWLGLASASPCAAGLPAGQGFPHFWSIFWVPLCPHSRRHVFKKRTGQMCRTGDAAIDG